jgi:hypothetical protein
VGCRVRWRRIDEGSERPPCGEPLRRRFEETAWSARVAEDPGHRSARRSGRPHGESSPGTIRRAGFRRAGACADRFGDASPSRQVGSTVRGADGNVRAGVARGGPRPDRDDRGPARGVGGGASRRRDAFLPRVPSFRWTWASSLRAHSRRSQKGSSSADSAVHLLRSVAPRTAPVVALGVTPACEGALGRWVRLPARGCAAAQESRSDGRFCTHSPLSALEPPHLPC